MMEPKEQNAILDAVPEVTLRIPGQWREPGELASQLPEGYRLDPERLHMPDGASVGFTALPPDDEFAPLFLAGCQNPPTPEERQIIEHFRVNACLTGPGGSLDAARRMLQAGAALLRAGGAGVFVDNSGLSHSREDWLAMADDADPTGGGLFWAFVATIRSEHDMWSVGMHVFGLRDAIIPRSGDDQLDQFNLNNFLGFTYSSGEHVTDGDLIGDEDEPMFRLRRQPTPNAPAAPGSPMYNPYGQWKLEPIGKDEEIDWHGEDGDGAGV